MSAEHPTYQERQVCPDCGLHFHRQDTFTAWPVERFERYWCPNGHQWTHIVPLTPLGAKGLR